jgi:hypothetical protein
LAIAKTSDIIFIATEVLFLSSPNSVRFSKFGRTFVTHLSLKEQNCWLITCQTISSEDIARKSGFHTKRRIKVLQELEVRCVEAVGAVLVYDCNENVRMRTEN